MNNSLPFIRRSFYFLLLLGAVALGISPALAQEGEGALGEGEGFSEGLMEGLLEGSVEGLLEGALEGEGAPEGLLEGVSEGLLEGLVEGLGEGEGALEGEGEGVPEALVYVDRGALSPLEDGTSWATAYRTLQPAIDAAQALGAEVWVAGGRYSEPRPSGGSLRLRPGVALFGGFAGGEILRSERDWVKHQTTIDGFSANAGSPAASVIIGADDAILDGFIVRGGRGIFGGGMRNQSVSPRIVHCVFTDNRASNLGGGIFNTLGAAPEIVNSVFYNNRSEVHGGAVANDRSSPRFIGVTFGENFAAFRGAAIYNIESSSPAIVNCILWNNQPEEIGSTGTSDPDLSYTLIRTVTAGAGNVFADPLFLNPGIGNFQLRPGSPAIDQGRDTAGPEFGGITRDFRGAPRGFDGDELGIVTADRSDYDMGALEFTGVAALKFHSADTERDFDIDLTELLRVIQFFNSGGYTCSFGTIDGYAPGRGSCAPGLEHSSDFAPQDFIITLPELLRAIQFFNTPSGYTSDPATADGFRPNV